MSKRTYAIIIVILIAGLLLTACERSASVSPIATATKSGEIPFPVATQSQIMKDILAATQTAAAASGTITTGGLPGAATSTPAFTFSTPTPLGTPYSGTQAAVLSTATPTKITYPTPTPGRPTQYTVQSGEFPFCLARRFNVDAGDLLAANGLSINSQVSIGTTLTIPQSGTWTSGARALKAHPTTYTVVYGDTIGLIACGFGDADPNTILAANGLAAGAVLSQGQVLQIP
ncbi:MAG: LysM peptidoglycan-binding domain-containing protein [Anaerolineaceae bacterium]